MCVKFAVAVARGHLRGMRRIGIALGSLVVLAALTGAVRAQSSKPECVTVVGSARWAAAGYNHWVIVTNRCERRVTCQVATDVSPQPTRVEVEPDRTQEVLTFRDSPASEFTPRVTCELASR